jgi:hypothetical protein
MMMSFALDDVLTVLGEQPGAAAAFSVLPAGASEVRRAAAAPAAGMPKS